MTSDQQQRENVPGWAAWLKLHINGATVVVGALGTLLAALIALYALVPWPTLGPDCSNYSKLTKDEIEKCQTLEK